MLTQSNKEIIMFGLLDKVVGTVINTAASVVSPVTELVGVDKRSIVALGRTVYEISELTGIAQDIIESFKE